MIGKNYPILEALPQRPSGIGKVFFVDNGGDTGNEGTDPNYPLKTITAAIALCNSSDKGDTIIVMQESPSAPTSGETWPIVINKPGILLAGLYSRGLISDSGFGSNDVDENTIDINANYITIEDLYLQVKTGGTTGVVISTSLAPGAAVYAFTLRNCWVGLQNTGLYGIYSGDAIDWPYLLIEDNTFSAPNASNFTSAIYLFNATFSKIRRNTFLHCSSYAIHLLGSCGNVEITDNRFKLSADTDGFAIFAAAGSSQCYIDGNRAAHGIDDPTNDPFWDANGAGSANNWGLNYKGKTATNGIYA